MAAAQALGNRHIVSHVLHHLYESKFKARVQQAPDQPVEFFEFRPRLLPSILVNKLWAEEGTSILWKHFPALAALKSMTYERRQWYANKIESIYSAVRANDHHDLGFLEGLQWPSLRNLELNIDWRSHGSIFRNMLHVGLENLELSGFQTGDSNYFADTILPSLLVPCRSLKSIHIGSQTIDAKDPVDAYTLLDCLDLVPSIQDIRIMKANFMDKDLLFTRLSQRPGLQALEIGLDPGIQLLPYFSGPNALPCSFASLRRLRTTCYPEIALALLAHLPLLQKVQLNIVRIPQEPVGFSDLSIFDDVLASLSQCPDLRVLSVNVGQLAIGFPSERLYPSLSGKSLMGLATSCSNLQDISIFVSRPSAINGSAISSRHFEAFCESLPHLRSLCLDLHPTTATSLQASALQSLGKFCPDLEVLRIKVPLQLPSLTKSDNAASTLNGYGVPTSPTVINFSRPISPTTFDAYNVGQTSPTDSVLSSTIPTPNIQPRFPRLTRLGLARPKTLLSATSTVSPSKLAIDPAAEKDLVRSWAQPLLKHFPRLEILEAWGDSDGWDTDSLHYFLLPEKDEVLATMWEFLSGLEQDLWLDGVQSPASAAGEAEHITDHYEEESSLGNQNSEEDWGKASLMNEFPVSRRAGETRYMDAIHEEPEDSSIYKRTLTDDLPNRDDNPRVLRLPDGYDKTNMNGLETTPRSIPAVVSNPDNSVPTKQNSFRGLLKSMICTRAT